MWLSFSQQFHWEEGVLLITLINSLPSCPIPLLENKRISSRYIINVAMFRWKMAYSVTRVIYSTFNHRFL